MLSVISAIILISFTSYMALIYDDPSLVRLSVVEAMFLVVSVIYLFIRRKKTKCRIQSPVVTAEAGKTAKLTVMVRNSSVFFSGRMKCRINYNDGSVKKKKWFDLMISEKDENVFTIELTPEHAGRYEFTVGRCRLYDKLGLFYLTRKFRSSTSIIILPEPGEVAVTLSQKVIHYYGDSDLYDDLRPGRDSGETFEIREFRAGDKIQKINWKLSAKKDEILMREGSLPKACPVILFFSFPEMSKKKGTLMEDSLRKYAGISFALMDSGCPHYYVWPSASSKSLIRVRVDDEESYFLALTNSIGDAAHMEYEKMKEEYKEKYRGEIHISDIWLEDGRAFLDGERIPEKDGILGIYV
ncbi:Protein of unknown function DUF58 [Eubacterium ruminantium]|nr:Protein of unknown function DUF58 [Eubacterium ruminantium]